MANALYEMEAYDEYLLGQPFTLFMDERPQPELSHFHKKTLSGCFFGIQLHHPKWDGLRHASEPQNGQLGPGSCADPDQPTSSATPEQGPWSPNPTRVPDLIHLARKSSTRLWLETLNQNLMINPNNVMRVQCQPESPEALPKTALYVPFKFRAPMICQFWQRNPDITLPQQVPKLQKNYCWTGMKKRFEPTSGVLYQLCPT